MSFHHRSFRFLALASVMASGVYGQAHAQVIYRHTAPAMPSSASPIQSQPIQIIHHDAPAPAPVSAPPVVSSEPSPVYPSGGDGGHVIPADHFGREVPFSIAVMSILPAGYTAQYDSSVDQNALVNWAGGRPWRDIMDTLSASRGYDVRYSGKTVSVSSSGNTAGAVVSSAPVSIPAAQPAPVVQSAAATTAPTEGLHVHHATPPAEVSPVSAPAQESIPANPEPTDLGVEPVQQSVTARDLGLKVVGGNVQGSQASSRQFSDGGLVPSDSLSGERPRLSYAPKGGGRGIYYGAAGQDVVQVLRVWAAANGWNVVDDTRMSYKLDVPVSLRGDFKSSVRAVLNSLAATPHPEHIFLNGGSTLHLFLQEDQSEERPTGSALKMHMGRHQF